MFKMLLFNGENVPIKICLTGSIQCLVHVQLLHCSIVVLFNTHLENSFFAQLFCSKPIVLMAFVQLTWKGHNQLNGSLHSEIQLLLVSINSPTNRRQLD